jgi:two-component system aerobic respiration control sensor histidine kinase ArcB
MSIKSFFSLKSKKNQMIHTHFDYVINNVPHFLFWKDHNGIFLGCNKAFSKSAGFQSPEDLVGKTDYDMPWKENAIDYINDDKHIMDAGKPRLNYEEYQRQADGTSKVMLVSKVPMFDEGHKKIIGILGVYTDISERKAIEEELKEAKEKAEIANTAKNAFLENMRHDIRTPLSGIIGFAELLRNEKNPDKIGNYTNKLVASSTELLNFLNEILESIHIASGEIPLVHRQFNLKDIFKSLSNLYQPKAHEKKLTLEFHFDEKISPYLIGDPVRIYRVILELLGNALKFTQEGRVDIYAKISKKNDEDIIIQIEVKDTGAGISSENQHELFVRFKRFTPSSQGIYQGSGLGLSIVKQFIEDLQGEIYYDTKNTTGAKFICLIPLKEALLQKKL